MKRSEWAKTPYAGTVAKQTEENIARLLARYGIEEYQTTQQRGPNGRPAFVLRFMFKERMYRVPVETLDVKDVPSDALLNQAKRAVYHFLKCSLEMQTVFFTPEQALFAFVELPGSECTMYEAAAPKLETLTVSGVGRLLLLPGSAGSCADKN